MTNGRIPPDKLAIIRQHQQVAPVDVVALGQALGVRAWESDKLPSQVAGKLFYDAVHGGTENYSIVVNTNDPVPRKRFTIAHEIAHFLLHRDRFEKELVDDVFYRSVLHIREEAEANRLAADILMPEHLLASGSQKSLPELARQFQVSELAMHIRRTFASHPSSG